jgi:hypothetical protein
MTGGGSRSALSRKTGVELVRSSLSERDAVMTQLFFLSSLPARVGALPLGGLAILEACCFVGAAGGIAGAVRMSAGTR